MRPATKILLHQAVDRHMPAGELNGLLKSFIARKEEEQSAWAELTRATHELCGGSHPRIEELAAVTELILLALDIVDDLQDKDNPEMPWLQCGSDVALNAILALIFASVGEFARLNDGSGPAIDLYFVSQLLSESVRGQQLDISQAVQSEPDYIQMIGAKSGSLLRFACYIGYAAAGLREQSAVQQMEELALIIGIIIQLRNDVRDVQRWDLKNDLLQKKKTLPILFMLADEQDPYEPLLSYYEDRLSRDEFLLLKRETYSYIESCGCLQYASVIQSLYRNRAEELLRALGHGTGTGEAFLTRILGASA